MKSPQFTVLMPVYNAGRHLRQAVTDVLRQTFRDFELLVVDDGSTDDSLAVVRGFDDPRVRILELGKNRGLVGALNAGLAEARGQWIARQDADDRCHQDRLEQQSRILGMNPEAVLIYSRARLIGGRGWWRGSLNPPVDDPGLRWDLCFRNAVPHTSAAFPGDLVRDRLGGYRGDNVTADYDLWSRLLRLGVACGVPRQLVSYRNHASSIMGQDRQNTPDSRLAELGKIRRDNLQSWLRATDDEADAVVTAWTRPGEVDWARYFETTRELASRAAACGMRAGHDVLREEDYTLLHLAMGAGRDRGRGFLDAMVEKCPERRAALPPVRTLLTRWKGGW